MWRKLWFGWKLTIGLIGWVYMFANVFFFPKTGWTYAVGGTERGFITFYADAPYYGIPKFIVGIVMPTIFALGIRFR